MAISYLNTTAEEAYRILDDCIVKGYKTMEAIEQAYHFQKAVMSDEIINDLQKIAHIWFSDSFERLKGVFVSERELYNFKYAKTDGLSREGVNMKYESMYKKLRARINVLNGYIDYIVHSFNIDITADRDANVQIGSNNKQEVKNK